MFEPEQKKINFSRGVSNEYDCTSVRNKSFHETHTSVNLPQLALFLLYKISDNFFNVVWKYNSEWNFISVIQQK